MALSYVRRAYNQTMLFPAVLLGMFWMPQTHPATHPAKVHTAHTTPVEHHAAAGPKTAAELQQDLTAAMHAAPLGADRITLSLAGKDITLSGEVHTAEDKGLATREARKVAEKDGWSGFHVRNQIAVKLSGL